MKYKKTIYCMICNTETNLVAESFGRWHLNKHHQITMKDYYDKFIKKSDEGKCSECNSKTKFISFNQGYLKHCSNKCAGSNIEIQKKIKKIKKEKYGDENYTNREKAKQTNLKKIGVENVSQSLEIKNKKKETLKLNYGVENPLQSQIIKNKIINTCLKKYGVKNPSMAKDVKEKRVKTIIKKYGVDHYSKSLDYRKLQELLGKWIPLEFKSDFEIYRMLVWNETEKWKKKLFLNWNGNCFYTNEKLIIDKSQYNNPLYATIEHKISIFEGFKKKLAPEYIGNIENLCICSRISNTIKGVKTEKQFLNYLKNKK